MGAGPGSKQGRSLADTASLKQSVSYNDSGRSRPIVHQNHQLHHPHPLSQNRPQPIYDNRPPVSTYGEAF